MSNKDDKSHEASSILTRDEFISNFKSDTNNRCKRHKKITGQRWIFLYNLNKLQQVKLTKKILTQQKEIDYLLTQQCTFSPKTNKLPKYLVTTYINHKSTENMLKRQATWIHNLTIKNETLKQMKNNQLTTQCTFHPIIVYLLYYLL